MYGASSHAPVNFVNVRAIIGINCVKICSVRIINVRPSETTCPVAPNTKSNFVNLKFSGNCKHLTHEAKKSLWMRELINTSSAIFENFLGQGWSREQSVISNDLFIRGNVVSRLFPITEFIPILNSGLPALAPKTYKCLKVIFHKNKGQNKGPTGTKM